MLVEERVDRARRLGVPVRAERGAQGPERRGAERVAVVDREAVHLVAGLGEQPRLAIRRGVLAAALQVAVVEDADPQRAHLYSS
jgi:hypothetical protein